MEMARDVSRWIRVTSTPLLATAQMRRYDAMALLRTNVFDSDHASRVEAVVLVGGG
jgi:uncharacterized membrane protein